MKVGDKLSLLLTKLEEKHNELTKYREALRWKILRGNPEDAHKADFDDSSWEEAALPLTLDATEGDVWLRCEFLVPQKVAGIETAGSTVKLTSSPILGRAEIFVNSRLALKSEYWTELRVPIVLGERVKPRSRYVVAVHIVPVESPVSVQVTVPRFKVTLSKVEEVAFELDSFIQELRFAHFLDEATARQIVEGFNIQALKEGYAFILDEVEKARAALSTLSERAKEFKVHLVAHAHIDMNWLWPWDDTVETVRETFTTMVKLMDKYPSFHFSQSQAVTYNVVEENFPKLFEAIREYVAKGNWDVTAAMWVEADLNMAGTEALVRQFLYGRLYVKESFGVEPKVCWEPDTFGHVWTLPQILRKSGVRYYYFMRCGKDHPLFWWMSPDGSKVLAFTSVYNNTITPKKIVEAAIEMYERYGLKTSMFVYGVGDHGGGATEEDIEAAIKIAKKPALPSAVFSTTHGFFEEVEGQIREIDVPLVNDELNFIFDGCYTTHSDIKRYNRLCERLLVDAEKLCAVSGKYPREALKKAWLNTLFNQFHDILDGSGTHRAYDYPKKLAEETIEFTRETLERSLKEISEKIGFSSLGIPVVVFNTLPWERRDIVRVKVSPSILPRNPVAVSGEERSPVQVSGEEIMFLAKVPSMGYRTYYIVEGKKSEEAPAGSGEALENEYLRVEVDKASGTIRSLYDKTSGRFVFKRDRYPNTRPVLSNLLQVLYEVPHGMSAWIIGAISRTENLIKGADVGLVENGPVRAMIRVVHKYRRSTITQEISVYKGLPRVDFHTTIDWRETADGKSDFPMLKVSFTPILGDSKATFEIPFGYIERVADGTEVPALRWVDLSDGNYGLSILNDSKYGFDVQGNTVRMTLIRTSYSPDPRPDQGTHHVLYSIYPHKGDWREAQTFRRGYEINHPLEAVVFKELPTEAGSEPEEASFIEVDPENVVLSCLKLAEDSNDYIIRVYDATGEGADAEVRFKSDLVEAFEVDMMEKPLRNLRVNGRRILFRLHPFEIKTIRVSMA